MPKFSLLMWASLLGGVLFVTGFAWAGIWSYAHPGIRQVLIDARPPEAASFLVTIGSLILLPCMIVKVDKLITARKLAKK